MFIETGTGSIALNMSLYIDKDKNKFAAHAFVYNGVIVQLQ